MKYCLVCNSELNKSKSGYYCIKCKLSKTNKVENNEKSINSDSEIISKTEILRSFPFGKEPRKIQKEILYDLENAIKQGKKFIILEAPTGCGKSWIAATVGLWLKGAIILTPQKNLERQYMKDFGQYMLEVRGKQNFPCLQLDEIKDCSKGECFPRDGETEQCEYYCAKEHFTIPENVKCTESEIVVLSQKGIEKFGSEANICHYWMQRRKGEIASNVVYNYAMYVSSYLNEDETPDNQTGKIVRNVLICDEAHELEDLLVEDGSLDLTEKYATIINSQHNVSRIKNITTKNFVSEVVKIIRDLISEYNIQLAIQKEHSKCSRYLASKEHIKEHSELNCPRHSRTIKKCEYCIKKINFIETHECFRCKIHMPIHKRTEKKCVEDHTKYNQFIRLNLEEKLEELQSTNNEINEDYKNYVVSSAEINQDTGQFTISIKPISVKKKANKLFEDFKHVIFLSSTIDNKIFSETVGIQDVFYKRYSSPFEIKNRQIIRRYVTELTYKNRIEEIKKIIKQIEQILDEHPNDKGIIHVSSYDYQNLIVDQIDKKYFDRLFVLDRDSNKEELLEKHEKLLGNQVIISPGCWTGVDLKGEQSRFQIITKAPYLPETLWVKSKRENFENGREWYEMRAIYKTIQGAGRSIRSSSDYAVTYLLDYKIEKLLNSSKLVPKWFLDSITGPNYILRN